MSLQIREHVSLQAYNSFGFVVAARWYAEAEDEQDVCEALAFAAAHGLPVLLLGGGSNLVLTRDVEALVLRMAARGVRILEDDGQTLLIEAEAGEPWHPFVQQTLALGASGLENLSLIPGTVGAAPVQNIGAYGVELKDVFAGLTALDRNTGERRDFSLADCAFAYRDSLFKREPGRWV
ncbi:MAG: FAD-binding protein, partial [Gammaproteobacteria bacterium]|nr:FAD-binding protein [Gammaproteobacteria bacterium]